MSTFNKSLHKNRTLHTHNQQWNVHNRLHSSKCFCITWDHISHFLSSIPSGGVPSTFFCPTSFQFVDSTVPFDSTWNCIWTIIHDNCYMCSWNSIRCPHIKSKNGGHPRKNIFMDSKTGRLSCQYHGGFQSLRKDITKLWDHHPRNQFAHFHRILKWWIQENIGYVSRPYKIFPFFSG